MEERFVVQKRPVTGGFLEEFYFRIVDTLTGAPYDRIYGDVGQAEGQCQRLNSLEPEKLRRSLKNGHLVR